MGLGQEDLDGVTGMLCCYALYFYYAIGAGKCFKIGCGRPGTSPLDQYPQKNFPVFVKRFLKPILLHRLG